MTNLTPLQKSILEHSLFNEVEALLNEEPKNMLLRLSGIKSICEDLKLIDIVEEVKQFKLAEEDNKRWNTD